jgi:hypothetical protein
MKKIILTIMIMSSCQINAYQKRLSSLWRPVSHATQIGFRAPASVIRTKVTSSPAEVQEAFKNPTLWQKFRGWFSKKPVNITPANITIGEQLRAINFELETVKKLVKAPGLATQAETLAAAIRNLEDSLSSYNNLLANDTIRQIRKESEERLLRRLKNNEDAFKERELKVRAKMTLQDIIDQGFFEVNNIDINDSRMFSEALNVIEFIQRVYLYYPYIRISFKMSTIKDREDVLTTSILDIIEYIEGQKKEMINFPTSKVHKVNACVAQKEGIRVLEILRKEIQELDAQKIQEGQAESK